YFCRPISPRLSRPRRLPVRKIFRCEEWDNPYSLIRDRTCVDVVLVVVLVLETKASEGGRRRCLRLYSWIRPRRVAFATASVRLMTFILAKNAFTCDLTVPSLINSAAPIALLLFPCAISLSTSISRELNVSPLTRSASFAARWTGTHVSPACTGRLLTV